jgi:PAS domain S-box-containing protein
MPQCETNPLSLEQLGRIVEGSASETYIFGSKDFRFLLVNRGARRNLGFTRSELEALTPWDIKPGLDEQAFRKLISPLLSGEKTEMVFETLHQRKDGSRYDVSVHLQMIPADGQPFFFAAIRDITDEKRLKTLIERQNDELKAALQAKEFLLREVHHRVKNSLAVVSALLGLQANQSRSGEVASALSQAQERVGVIASIHERLYQDDNHDQVDLADYLDELARKTAEHMMDGDRVRFESGVERGMMMPLDRAIPLALVVTEMLTNSLKYAFPDGRAGKLALLVERAGKEARIVVSDDGVGIEASRTAERPEGLGSKIISGLSRQADAKTACESGERGTRHEVLVPLG